MLNDMNDIGNGPGPELVPTGDRFTSGTAGFPCKNLSLNSGKTNEYIWCIRDRLGESGDGLWSMVEAYVEMKIAKYKFENVPCLK